MGTPTLDNITSGKYTNHLTYQRLKKDDQEHYLQRLARYRAEDARLLALFRSDLEEEFGVSGHPKAYILFELAWNYGKARGFLDVYTHYANFAQLIQ